MPVELRWIYEAMAARRSTGSTVARSRRINLDRWKRLWVLALGSVQKIFQSSPPPDVGEPISDETFPFHIRLYLLVYRLIIWPYRLARRIYWLIRRFFRLIVRFLLRKVSSTQKKIRRATRIYTIARQEVALIRHGLLTEFPNGTHAVECVPKRVLYLVYNSLPFHSAGYATRSHGLVAGIRDLGFDSAIVSRLGYPHVFGKFRNITTNALEHIENVPYLRLYSAVDEIFSTSTREYVKRNTAATINVAAEIRPSIIHGASNFVTGLTAVGVARALGVPSVYEVRGLWEITALSRDPSYTGTLRYAQAVRLETEACLGADRVITITEALRDELVRRGVPEEKIDIVPNGVDSDRFHPRPRDDALGVKLGLTPDNVVIGYVGSILDYEGLDDLLSAIRLCVDRGLTDLRALIVGDGAAYQACVDWAHELNLEDYVIFTGRVPHDEVEAYYSLIDITPFPRKPLPVCEMVSPLKPFEAMAMGKCVIVSSVAALQEIIGDRPIGFVFEKGSVEALAQTLSHVAVDRNLRLKIGEEARRFTVAERDWRILARRVTEIYEKLTVTGAKSSQS